MTGVKSFEDLVKKYGKKCPKCGGWKLSTYNNNWPLQHRCLDCGQKMTETKEGIIECLTQ